MIVIFTTIDDHKTEQIISQIKKLFEINIHLLYCENYLLNENNYFNISNNNLQIEIFNQNEKINLKDVKLFWYLRFTFSPSIIDEIEDIKNFRSFYESEISEIHYFLNKHIYKNYKTLNSPFKGITNKLEQLEVIGWSKFNIPNTTIVNSFHKLSTKNNKLITKAISNLPIKNTKNSCKVGYTSRINQKDIAITACKIFPTLVQQEISIKCEIRIFYILKKIYATCIIVDRKKNIDYRKTNYSNNYKSIRVQLSTSFKKNIIKIMNDLNLDSGSIDVIIDQEDNPYILEINKYGQFGMIENRHSDSIYFEIFSSEIKKHL